ERGALLFGLGFGGMGFAVYGLADEGWIFLIGLPISALWGVAAPATQALITRLVAPDVQGRIQGGLSSLMAMAGILGPTIFAESFGYFVADERAVKLPGVPFFIGSFLLVVALV